MLEQNILDWGRSSYRVILGPKNFGPKNLLGPKRIWIKKNFGQTILCPKEFCVQKKLGSNKILGPKKIWAQIILGLKISRAT